MPLLACSAAQSLKIPVDLECFARDADCYLPTGGGRARVPLPHRASSPRLSSRQGVEQRLGILQVGSVKPLGEPAVGRRQQFVGFLALALGLPQAGQASGCSQLPGFRLLAAGNGQGLLETGFYLHHIRRCLAQEECTLEPIRLGQQVALPAGFQYRQGFGQQTQPLLDLANMPYSLRE